ncbi:MAG TPA: LacI family DNA-binding transcriptional regulator [Candidatus Saccharimonadales bacterium]|nr:LacI family DNA-binding transcriptional regulator [Candidatus Saccharimonadales bacterium]
MPLREEAVAHATASAPAQTAKPANRVSLRDIARKVGVTPVSVSLAMRNSSRISAGVRQKIQKTAQEMGYRPDPMLSALAHYRRATVKTHVCAELAWINCWTDPKKLRAHKEFDLYWSGAFDEAEKCGYRLEELIFNHNNLSTTRLQEILEARNIQGILLPPLPPGAPQPNWQGFEWDKFCSVRFGYSLRNLRLHIVSSDQLANGIMACENIRRLGYPRIGLVTGVTSNVRFAAGYLQHQMRYDSISQLLPLKLREASRDADRQTLAAWIKKYKPDAIFTDCAQLPNMLKELGVRLPSDIGVATTSTLDGNVDAGIHQNSDEIGRAAIQLVISLIHHGEFGVPRICREVLVEGSWVDGGSLPAKK